MKAFILGMVAAAALVAPTAVSAQSYDANPRVGFVYGAGNDYTPANAVVLTTNAGTGTPTTADSAMPGKSFR